MSNKDGAMFSKSLFGYKKRDVNEYIRLADESNSERLKENEARIKDLEDALLSEKAAHQTDIKNLSDEKESFEKKAEQAKQEFDKKFAESEDRCASYIKLADNATQRAEAAELQVSELSSEIESYKEEIATLKERSNECETQIIQLTAEIARLSVFEEKEKADKVRFFKIRRPSFFKIVKK